MANKKMELHLHYVKKTAQGAWSPAKYVMTARVIELGRLRELTLKGSLASPTSITRKGTRFRGSRFHSWPRTAFGMRIYEKSGSFVRPNPKSGDNLAIAWENENF